MQLHYICRQIKEYKSVVFGEVVNGVNFLKDYAASIRNIIGGWSGSYENELTDSRTKVLNEMERERKTGLERMTPYLCQLLE